MKLEIEKISNGFLLSWEEEIEDRVFRNEKETIEETDNPNGEKEAMTKLLYRISDYFGVSYDKWKENNLKISWNKKGSKM